MQSTTSFRGIALPAALSLSLVGGALVAPLGTLETSYEKETQYAVSIRSSSTTESENEISMDGQPMEGRWGGGGASEQSFLCSFTDTVLASEGGTPLKVQRVFEDVEGNMMAERRGEPVESDLESSFSGVTLVLEDVDGEVQVTVEDGDELEPERLAGFDLALALDGLLPSEDVDEGGSWDIEPDALKTALSSGMATQLIDRPEPDAGGEGRGGGRRGRGNRGLRGDALSRLFSGDYEWNTQATLTDRTEEFGGVECIVIEVEAEMQGNLPERGGRGGRGGGGDAVAAPSAPLAGTISAELEGELLWNPEQNFPARFTVTGTIESQETRGRETERGYFEMNRSSSTEIETSIEVAVPAKDEDKDED